MKKQPRKKIEFNIGEISDKFTELSFKGDKVNFTVPMDNDHIIELLERINKKPKIWERTDSFAFNDDNIAIHIDIRSIKKEVIDKFRIAKQVILSKIGD